MKLSAQEKFNKACEETNALSKDIWKLNDTMVGKEIVARALIDVIMYLPKNKRAEFISEIRRKAEKL
jgi:hypothetical protein